MKAVVKLVIAIGLGATLLGGFDVWLLVRGTKEPERITLEELGKADGTRNVHLSISNFTFGKDYVWEADRDGRWVRVWLPLLSPDGRWTSRPVVAWSNTIPNESELGALFKRSVLTGVVTNGRQSLGSNQQQIFAEKYPNVDLSAAIAFQVEGPFPSPWIAYPVTAIGVLLLAIGLRLLFGLFRKHSGGPPSEQLYSNP